jgi:hypothetical protein
MIRVHSGMRLEFKPENITSDSGRSDARWHDASGKAAFGEQTNLLTIGEFDPGSG